MYKWFKSLFATKSQYQQLIAQANQPQAVTIDKIGKVHIIPMDAGMRLALTEIAKADNQNTYSIYLWLISVCVLEFKGRDAAQIGQDLRSTDVINDLGNAVLDVSGLSAKGQAEHVKKSQPVPS